MFQSFLFAGFLLLLQCAFVYSSPSSFEYYIGDFFISISFPLQDVSQNPSITVQSQAQKKINSQVFLFECSSGCIRVGNASVLRPPILDGNFQLQEATRYLSSIATVDTQEQTTSDGKDALLIQGRLLEDEGSSVVAYYQLLFASVDVSKLAFSIIINATTATNPTSLSSSSSSSSSLSTRLFLKYAAEANEGFYGFGESFTYLDLKGRRVPILVSEQGVGRGEEPITSYLNTNVTEGVGGHWYTTYSPRPIYVTSYNRSIYLDNSQVAFFDLTDPLSVEIEVWASSISGYIFSAGEEGWPGLIETITSVTGRQPGRLPLWSQLGAVVGLEGGVCVCVCVCVCVVLCLCVCVCVSIQIY